MPNAAASLEHLIGTELVEIKYDAVIFHSPGIAKVPLDFSGKINWDRSEKFMLQERIENLFNVISLRNLRNMNRF